MTWLVSKLAAMFKDISDYLKAVVYSILSRLYQFPTKHSGAVFYRPVPLDWWGL